jgi:hypothetical protein
MASEPGDLKRREAQDRVTFRFDRQNKALTEIQRKECERDTQLQQRLLDASVARQADFEAAKEQRLAAHDRLWEQAKDRLTPRPGPAPSFDMMGGPPARNLVQDHDEMLRSWTAQRDEIAKDFDERIADCERTRAETLEGFGRANEDRDQGHKEDRLDLEQRQQQSFDRLVNKEIERADEWVSKEFKQRSRDDNERDL